MFKVFKNIFLFFGLIGLTACMTPTKPTIHFASANAIAIKYSAYDVLPTVTAEAIDMAVEHCKKHGKGTDKYLEINGKCKKIDRAF